MKFFEGPCETAFNYNGGFDGDVRIKRKDIHGKEEFSVEIPMEDLIAFVSEYVRGQKISQLEGMEPDELLLGLKPDGGM